MVVDETCKITARGQTTAPKAIRKALGVDTGGRIAFRRRPGDRRAERRAGVGFF